TKCLPFGSPFVAGQGRSLDCSDDRIELGRLVFVDRVESLCDTGSFMALDENLQSRGVEFAARHAQFPGEILGSLEERIRKRDRGLHTRSITEVIPGRQTLELELLLL